MLKSRFTMTASTSMSLFCQWLLNEPEGNTPPTAIVLHGDPVHVNDTLINEISQYLNEYDDEADGLWLNATTELISKVATDPNSRRLLGMQDIADQDQANTPREFLSTLHTLIERGHLVFQAPGGGIGPIETSRAFHAGVGRCHDMTTRCHIIIDPEMVASKCVPQIIADVFLEWAHCDERDCKGISKIR